MHRLKKLALVSAASVALLTGGYLRACPNCEAISAAAPAVLFQDVTALNRPITTASLEAQKYFDQGLTLVYAFNHDEAIRSFKKAAELDPNCAMAWWGVALALGPNYNMDVTPETELAAYQALQKAVKLKDKVSQIERDYIDALAVRYTDAKDPDLKQLARNYADAMRKLSEKYPDDTDAATLYADSMMLLRPWKLWKRDGTPEEGTATIVATLEEVMRRDPDHLGANHLYIHAVEASPNPEKALPSADRLPLLSPGSGHVVHMPSHIYIRVGDYNSAATSNEAAIKVDDEYFTTRPRDGAYRMLYYNHNVHFAAVAHAYDGRPGKARAFAVKLHDEVAPLVAKMPPLEQFVTVLGLLDLYHKDWDAILAAPRPADGLHITQALWRFERAVALTARGDRAAADAERQEFNKLRAAIPSDTPYGMLNTAVDVLAIADHVLAARIAEKDGKIDEAIGHWKQAVDAEAKIQYEEPPAWPLSGCQSFGGVLLRAGRFTEAEQAFREDLKHYPRSGRSLFGLWKALEGQNRKPEAEMVRRQFETAWKRAETKLTVETL